MATGGALGCCKTCCCIFVVFINVLSIIFGVLFAILGVLLLWGSALVQSLAGITPADLDMNQTMTKAMFGSHINVESYYSSLASITGLAAGLLIAFGIVIVVVSCIGCFGACIGIPACLIIYVVCVALLFVGQVVVIIIWFANANVFKRSIRGTLEGHVSQFKGSENQNFESVSLNMAQILFGCCGIDNGTDFQVGSPHWNRTYSMVASDNRTITFDLAYPVSCCKHNLNSYSLLDPYCPYNGTKNSAVNNYNVGCYDKIWMVVDTHWQLDRLFYSLAGCLGLEILLILGAVIIFCAKREEARTLSGTHGEVEYKMVQQRA